MNTKILYLGDSKHTDKHEFTLEEILAATIVYATGSFPVPTERIYFCPKYEKLCTQAQLQTFLDEHEDESFLCIDNYCAHQIWAFAQALEDTGLQLFLIEPFSAHIENAESRLMTGPDASHMTVIGTLTCAPGEYTWTSQNVIAPWIQFKEFSYYGERDMNITVEYLEEKIYTRGTTREYGIIPSKLDPTMTYRGKKFTSSSILRTFLPSGSNTRIAAVRAGDGTIRWDTKIGNVCKGSIAERYGLPKTCDYSWRTDDHCIHEDLVFDGPTVDEKTKERVVNTLTEVLSPPSTTTMCGDNYNIMTADLTVITNPLPGHRRPTYHYFKGFKRMGNDTVDVVEIACGELLVEGMTPTSVYILSTKGNYIQLSHRFMGYVRNMIQASEIDALSMAEWSEDKSNYPQLIKAASVMKLNVDEIRIFNRISFGALFLEQLIKENTFDLAKNFAKEIYKRGDHIGYSWASLSDILPRCNPEGTSLQKILNLPRPSVNALLAETNVDDFVYHYKALQLFMPGNVSAHGEKLVEAAMYLYRENWGTVMTPTGSISILQYPKELVSIYKMLNKIKNHVTDASLQYDALRRYREIAEAYIKFLSLEWIPEDYEVYLEFGMKATMEETMKMLTTREHAANTALAIYQNKMDEKRRAADEKEFAKRLPAIRKLETTNKKDDPSMDPTSPLFGYQVVAPTQIYGPITIGSVEKEGLDMHHCVFRSYAQSIINGTYTIMYLRKKTADGKYPLESYVTIGISSEGRINQTYGKHDTVISETDAEAIAAWAKSKLGLVTFASEYSDIIRPSGWNPSIGAPKLPKPAKEWLDTLANKES